MPFMDLDNEQRRQLIDTRQVFEGWRTADAELSHRFAGSMRWKTIKGADYLYRKQKGRDESLGPRSDETEKTFQAFSEGKARLKERASSLAKRLDRLALVNKAVGLGRVPVIAARILRKLDEVGLLGRNVTVVGTNALFAYESLAGVRFSGDTLATGDFDILWDTRTRLRLTIEEFRIEGVLGLLRRVDRSFEVAHQPYRAENRDGYMVDLIRPVFGSPLVPERDPKRMGVADPELTAQEIAGLAWLVSCPKVEVVAIDDNGYPARMVVHDPRAFGLHKLWVARQPDRDPVKAGRDESQGNEVLALVRARLPQFDLTGDYLTALPLELRAMLGSEAPSGDEDKETGPRW